MFTKNVSNVEHKCKNNAKFWSELKNENKNIVWKIRLGTNKFSWKTLTPLNIKKYQVFSSKTLKIVISPKKHPHAFDAVEQVFTEKEHIE